MLPPAAVTVCQASALPFVARTHSVGSWTRGPLLTPQGGGRLTMPIDLPASSDVSLHDMVQATVTVLAVINPVVCGSIFLTLTPQMAPAQRRRAAGRAASAILIILVVSALIGLKVLSIFGISLDVFRIVGGMIVAYMGFDMLRGRQTVA